MARILVTGGAGFIGSHLVDTLVERGAHTVTVVDDLSVGVRSNVHRRARFIKMQIQNPRFDTVVKRGRYDFIFHLAAQKNLQSSKAFPVHDAETNIVGSIRLFHAAKKARVRKVIFFSSAAVYNVKAKPPNAEDDQVQPCTPYGIGKYTAELYLKNSGIPYVILRPSNVYGPRQDARGEGGVVAIFCRKLIQRTRPEIFNTGLQTRDFIYVDDVIRASVAAMLCGRNVVCNISTQHETTINTLYRILVKTAIMSLRPIRGKHIDEQYRSALSNLRARIALKWKPAISLAQGLEQTYNWFNALYGKKTVKTTRRFS
ncbi:MAG: NAD-dependent epimerase/dehydratase family protein [Patescibacteria group bacterium]|nr:NAD-dependent epimerase/dehydratase family protein [Patescibacteria group bacterium]MDD5715149.1 NAD-dependent epimerase/dehydratase family protein [Patescibacteria group bacterium]